MVYADSCTGGALEKYNAEKIMSFNLHTHTCISRLFTGGCGGTQATVRGFGMHTRVCPLTAMGDCWCWEGIGGMD